MAPGQAEGAKDVNEIDRETEIAFLAATERVELIDRVRQEGHDRERLEIFGP